MISKELETGLYEQVRAHLLEAKKQFSKLRSKGYVEKIERLLG